MIKNLLYSLFLHFLLLLVIYANFNLKDVNENKTSEIAVSLIALDGNDNASALKQAPSAAETEKKDEGKAKEKIVKEAKSPKKLPKDEVKKQPKKLAQAKPIKSIAKPRSEEKIQEFKHETKSEAKQEEANKIKEDQQMNENQDDEQNDNLRKEKDSGSKKKFNEEQEESKPASAKNDTTDMANNMENIDLSAREKFNIQSQLKRCYHRALDESKLSSKTKVLVKVRVSEDGYIDSDLEDLIDMDRYNNPQDPYKIAIDNVRRAIDLCSPLRNLPLDKYDVWKEVVLEFDEDESK